MMTETTVTMSRGCSYCKCRGMRIDLVVSIYQHLCMGKKVLRQEKINRNQEMLNADKRVLRVSQEK